MLYLAVSPVDFLDCERKLQENALRDRSFAENFSFTSAPSLIEQLMPLTDGCFGYAVGFLPNIIRNLICTVTTHFNVVIPELTLR